MYPTYFDEESIPPSLPHVKDSGRQKPYTDEQLQLARELNRYDVQLYEVAVSLFRRRAMACGVPEELAMAAVPGM